MGSTFISYSRRQYYFAESLALNLQQRGISVWFDIQQIEPGVKWQADIATGLTEAVSVTLIASRSALASPYVEKEWRHALDHGKPVFVALYERVRLPAALREQAIIVDFRGSFDQGVEALIAKYQNPTRSRPPNTWLPRLPPGVSHMALALTLRDIRYLMQVALFYIVIVLAFSHGAIARTIIDGFVAPVLFQQLLKIQVDVSAIFNVFAAVLAILMAIGYLADPKQSIAAAPFLKHDFGYKPPSNPQSELRTLESVQSIRQRWSSSRTRTKSKRADNSDIVRQVQHSYDDSAAKTIAIWLYLVASYAVAVVAPPTWQKQFGLDFSLEGLFLLLAAMILEVLLSRWIRRVVPHHPDPDIVRWATLGNVTQAWRQQISRGLLSHWASRSKETESVQNTTAAPIPQSPDLPPITLPTTYRIVYAPGDEEIAAKVRSTLFHASYEETSDEAAYTVLLLSYRTPLQLIRDCFKNSHQVIGVMATDINLPHDLPELSSTQLIDFRSTDPKQLQAFFSLLRDDSEQYRATYGLDVMPVRVEPTGENPALADVFYQLAVLAGINLLYAVHFLSRLTFLGISILPLAETFKPEGIGIVGLLLIMLILIWFGFGVLHGVARVPTKLLMLIAATSLIIMTLITQSGKLPVQSVDVPLSKPTRTIHLDNPQVLAMIVNYSLFLLAVARKLVGQPHLLNSPGAHVLGMRRIETKWPFKTGIVVLVAIILLNRFMP